MKTAAKAKLRALRDELVGEAMREQDDGKTEREEGGVDWPLERDEPAVERDHDHAGEERLGRGA